MKMQETRPAMADTGGFLEMNGYQWTVLFAAWLGWGFDIFDGLLFNYVAPNCVPTLLHLKIGSAVPGAATLHYTGIITSILLVGWVLVAILFGRVGDRVAGTTTRLLLMAMYGMGTALGVIAANI